MRFPIRAGLLLVAAIAIVATGPGSAADDDTAAGRAWAETDSFIVEIDGHSAPQARLFRTRGRASMLLLDRSVPVGVVIDPRSRSFRRVEISQLGENGEDGLIVPDAAIIGEPEPFTMQGGAVIFFLDGRRVRISGKPPLVGSTTIEAIFEHSPVYRKGMEKYHPEAKAIGYLTTFELPIKVEVFFGTWCPHCKETVPKFLRCIEEASNPNITVELTGVPSPPYADYPPVKKRGVKAVPTFIINAGTREIGRFSGVPLDSSIERELVKILAAYHAARG